MTKWILLALTLAFAWYVWKNDDFGSSFTDKSVVSQQFSSGDDWCEVKAIDCASLTKMLNALTPGRYFEEAGKLLGTSFENMTMVRENSGVTFLVPGGIKVVHIQSGREKGTVTVIFTDGYTMKYDKKGKLISVKK